MKCTKEIPNDDCLDDDTWTDTARYDINGLTNDFLQGCMNIFARYRHTGDAEDFYWSFYSSITSNATDYFPSLRSPACTTLSMKIADRLVAIARQQQYLGDPIKPKK